MADLRTFDVASRNPIDGGAAPGGVLIRAGGAAEVAERVAEAQHASAVPLLVAAALDGGLGAAVSGATEFPRMPDAAALLEAGDVRRAARLAAREARAIGVHLALLSTAPDAEPRIDAADVQVSPLAAYLRGLAEAGLAPAVRAFGFGSAISSPGTPPVSTRDRAWLETGDLALLHAAVDAGTGALVIAPVVIPALTGDTLPLPFSPATAAIVRRDYGFDGLLVADIGDGSLTEGLGEAEAAVRAVSAGIELLVGVRDADAVVQGLVAAVEQGRIPRSRIDEASRRVLRLKAELGLHRARPPSARATRRELRRREAVSLARRLFLESTLALGAPQLARADGERVVLFTPLGRGDDLAAELIRRGIDVRRVHVDPAADSLTLAEEMGVALAGADRVVYAEFESESRPSLGALVARAAGGAAGAARITEVRFVGAATGWPATASSLVSWGSGADAQIAAAERLATTGSPPTELPPSLQWPPAPVLRSAPAAEAGMSETGLAAADAIIRRAITDGHFPGAALAVGRRGVLVRLAGYGRLDPEADADPVDPVRTLFDLASLTKVVAPTALAMALVDDGVLELDSPVSRYLADWRAAASPGRSAAASNGKEGVTIRQLLSHTSGLAAGLAIHARAGSPEAARSLAIGAPLVLDPGAVALYSDLSMIVLAAAIEEAADEPLDRLLARRVLRPLGMESTMFLPPLALRGRIAPSARTAPDEFAMQGIVHDGTAFRLGGVAGHAGLFSTAADLAVFAQTMLNGGAYGARRVFSPHTVAAFRQPQPRADERARGGGPPPPPKAPPAATSRPRRSATPASPALHSGSTRRRTSSWCC